MSKRLRIVSATLLAVDEAEKLPAWMLKYCTGWWLKTPGFNPCYVAGVRCGAISDKGYFVAYNDFFVRPALLIKNLKSSIFNVGDIFIFGGKEFEIISDEVAFCASDIGRCVFRRDYQNNDANDYEKSDVKKYVDEWFDNAIASYGENPTPVRLSTKEQVKNVGSNYESIIFSKNDYSSEAQMWDDIRDVGMCGVTLDMVGEDTE